VDQMWARTDRIWYATEMGTDPISDRIRFGVRIQFSESDLSFRKKNRNRTQMYDMV